MSSATDLAFKIQTQTIVSMSPGSVGETTPAPVATMPPRPALTQTSVKDPQALHRHLTRLDSFLELMWRVVGSNVFAGGTNIRGVQMTAGLGVVLTHRLGRPYAGWTVTRLRASSGTYPTVIETPLPSGFTAVHSIQLEASKTCVLDVLVF